MVIVGGVKSLLQTINIVTAILIYLQLTLTITNLLLGGINLVVQKRDNYYNPKFF